MKRFFGSEGSNWKSAGLISAALTAAAPSLSPAAGTQVRPNIIFILADDLGPDGVGCYGGQTYAGCTPRIDALAAAGMRFTHCYAAPICSPSRAQYLTGQYPFRNGVISNGSNNRHDPDKPVLTKVLRDAGYTTGGSGKDVADDFHSVPGADETPVIQEFMDEYLLSGTGAYTNYTGYKLKGPSKVDPSPANYPYFPDALQAYALDFVERNCPRPENDFKPFYLYYSLIAPHAPLLPTPDSAPGTTDAKTLYGDNMKYVDKSVGQLVDKLKSLGILDNTIIVFSGDNGCWHPRALQGNLWDPKTSGYRPISGAKSDEEHLREGAALVPLIVHWPAAIKSPSVREELVDFTDMLPTFADLAGTRPPENWKLDGRSFAPLLRGDNGWKPREWSFVQLQYNWCVRGPQYRLNRDGRLFDMSDAPFSMTEIRPENDTPESAAARKMLQAVLDGFDPANGPTYEGDTDSSHSPKVWAWKKKHWDWSKQFETHFSGDRSDPDNDGVPNIFERAFGWDPNNGTDTMPKPAFKPGTREIVYPPVVSDSDVIITAVTEDGSAPDETTDIKNMRFQAARENPWEPPKPDPNRPATVR